MEASKPIDENPIVETKDENPKEETKEETKDETKEETKDETKEEIKETKNKKKLDDYSYFKLIIKVFKLVCFQVLIMVLLLLLYVNLYDNKVFDFIIYFCFGTATALLFIATLVLIKKLNVTSSKKYIDKYGSSIMIAFCKKYLHLSQENTGVFIALFDLSWHLFGSMIAFIFAKKYIINSRKTNNAFLISFILFCLWLLCNIYIIDGFKVYNKALELSKNETTTVIISVSITYSGLLYYFETIKNEKVKLINKLINK
jgi:cation transport ATPase